MGRQELVGKIKAEGRQTKKELKVTITLLRLAKVGFSSRQPRNGVMQ